MTDSTTVPEPKIFMSYLYADQDSAYGGDLRQFARDAVEALEGLFGRKATLFVDDEGGTWGENLRSQMAEELEEAHPHPGRGAVPRIGAGVGGVAPASHRGCLHSRGSSARIGLALSP